MLCKDDSISIVLPFISYKPSSFIFKAIKLSNSTLSASY